MFILSIDESAVPCWAFEATENNARENSTNSESREIFIVYLSIDFAECEILRNCLQSSAPQPEGVSNHRDRTKAHRGCCDHRIQEQTKRGKQDASRNRNSDDVVDECEE